VYPLSARRFPLPCRTENHREHSPIPLMNTGSKIAEQYAHFALFCNIIQVLNTSILRFFVITYNFLKISGFNANAGWKQRHRARTSSKFIKNINKKVLTTISANVTIFVSKMLSELYAFYYNYLGGMVFL
jgi:hypothetical protein